MREVQASDAKTQETIVITRHGRPIARLVPDEELRRAQKAEAVATIQELRKGTGRIGVGELFSMRDEGRT